MNLVCPATCPQRCPTYLRPYTYAHWLLRITGIGLSYQLERMHALRQEILPASGVEFTASLKLTPATRPTTPNVSTRHEFVSRVLCNLVVARSSLLRIFEVREEPAPIQPHVDDERERRANVRRGTEAVEGEVAMDEQGDGYINIAKVISTKSMYPIDSLNSRPIFGSEHC